MQDILDSLQAASSMHLREQSCMGTVAGSGMSCRHTSCLYFEYYEPGIVEKFYMTFVHVLVQTI